jgi:hypothetical protein
MTLHERIMERYLIALRWSRKAPNRLIVSYDCYENICPSDFNYCGMRVIRSGDVKEFELAFVFGDDANE